MREVNPKDTSRAQAFVLTGGLSLCAPDALRKGKRLLVMGC